MYKIGLSTPCGLITDENLASHNAVGFDVIEISDAMDGYARFDFDRAHALLEKYGIKPHSMHLPFSPLRSWTFPTPRLRRVHWNITAEL